MNSRLLAPLRWVLLLLAVAACGGGSSESDDGQTSEPGRLEASSRVNAISLEDITAAVREPDSRAAELTPVYAVVNHRIAYRTTDTKGRDIVASALVSVPVKGDGARSPVLAYQHATIETDAEAPSNDTTPGQAAVVLASLGYIVVAADYVGYGESRGALHPYLLSAPSAASVIDALTAARTWRERNGVADNGQLFLLGYSEGGYVTVATHRAMQSAGNEHLASLVAVTVGGGPYHVGATLDELLRRVRESNPVLGALIEPGRLSRESESTRRQVRNALLGALLGGSTDVLFDPTFIDNFLADDTAAIERMSNVHDWAPAAPLRLFHGRDDQTVPYESSTRTLQAMRERGASDVSLTDCTVTPSRHTECVPSFLAWALGGFAQRARDL